MPGPVRLWAFDLETYLMRPGLLLPRAVCGSWANEGGEWIGTAAEAFEFFAAVLERGDHLVGINLAWDIGVVAAARPDLLPLIFKSADQFHDCAILEALHDIAIDKLFIDYKTGKSFAKDQEMGGRYSMAVLSERHLGLDISAEKEGGWRFRYAELDGVPIDRWPEEARAYPLRDARRTYDIRLKQRGHKNKHDEPRQIRAAISIVLMQAWGLRTDGAYLDHLEREVDEIWNRTRAELSEIYRPDGSKDMERLRALVTAAYSGEPPKTAKGAIATDRDTLTESGNERLIKLGTSGKNDKRKTQYIPFLRRGMDVPINPQFNVLVGTGRVSSDMQQLPQKGGIREAIVARPGTVIASDDYGGLELRTMAQRAIYEVGFSKMAEMLNKKLDVHAYVGAEILGITYEAFLARKVELKPFRDVGKMGNFSLGGGAGPAAIVYNAKIKDNIRPCLSLGKATRCGERTQQAMIRGSWKRVCSLCVELVKQIKEKWLRAWPEQGLLFDKAGRLTKNGHKPDVIVFGSKRVRGRCGYTQWLNTPFQGAGGDGTKAAMWRIAEESYTDRRSPLWGSRTILNVHDELLTEHPEDRAHEAAFRVAEIMVEEMDKVTPDVKNEVTPAIMRRLFKGATDVYDRAGRLKPYWPEPWTWALDQEVMRKDKAA